MRLNFIQFEGDVEKYDTAFLLSMVCTFLHFYIIYKDLDAKCSIANCFFVYVIQMAAWLGVGV